MSLFGIILIISGILILRYAIRSAILAAQLGKLSEDTRDQEADGDWPAVPAPLIQFNSERRN